MKIIEFQTELQKAQKEGLTELLERLKTEDVDGFIVLVKTKNKEAPYIEAVSNVGFELIGVMEATKIALCSEMRAYEADGE